MQRREFLKDMLIAGAAPMLFNGCATGFLANRKLNVGIIGYGRIASTFEVPGVLRRKDIAHIVAVCDLDQKRAHYGAQTIDKAYNDGSKVAVYHDYKELCARPDIDAVMICLPDFWHALVASTAIMSGKAVWLQKPFTQTITEGRILANLAKKYNTVMQVGSQQRTWDVFRTACNAVLEGRIGSVKTVEVGIGIDKSGGIAAAEKVPETFDYETWLGPTDHSVPYNWTRCHNQDLKKIANRPGWIQLAPYGWGMITNWGAHHLDVARWGLGALGAEGVEGTCSWMDLSGGKLWNVHTNYDLHFKFNGGKTDVHVCDKYQNGVKFIGESGDWIFVTRSHILVTPSDPIPKMQPGMLPPLCASKPGLVPEYKGTLVNPMNAHVDNWLEAALAQKSCMTVTNAEDGHRSTSLCSLGQMCMELGRGKKSYSIDWDAKKEISSDAAANKMMEPFANGKFDLKVNLKEFGLDFDDVLKG